MATPATGGDPVADALQRAEHARDRLRALRRQQLELTRQRDQAVRELSARGLSYDTIAPLAGISRARVGQVVTAEPGGPAQSR